MAELAAGAVSSLLGVIRNEALLLRGVRDDVQFIKEEMESMKSFLAHLARWEPPGGEHDEQVRTWMNQVRLLAQDCNNCIDLYLYRGNPDIHRARGGLRRYLWWVSWFLHKLVAQHRAAEQLRQLKDRARDVGERRLRYGVEVPTKPTEGQGPPPAAASSSLARAAAPGGYAAGDEEEEGDDHFGRRAFIEPHTLDDYVEAKLVEWNDKIIAGAKETMSMVIVAPYTYRDVLSLARKTLVFGPDWEEDRGGYHCVVQVDIPTVHYDFLPLRPKEVLYYILLELENSKSQPRAQGTDRGKGAEEDFDSFQDYYRKLGIYQGKKNVLNEIKASIEDMKIYEKLDNITMSSDIRAPPQNGDQLLQLIAKQMKDVDQLDLDIIFQLLQKLPEWDDNSIAKIAKKLKEHMEEGVYRSSIQEEEEKEEEKKEEEEEEEETEGEEETTIAIAIAKEEEEATTITTEEEEEEEEETTTNHIKEKEVGEGREGGEEKTTKHMEKEEEDETTNHTEGEEEINHMEEEEKEGEEEEEFTRQKRPSICLSKVQYAHILRRVFMKTTSLQGQQQDRSLTKQVINITTAPCEDQIKQMIHKAKQEILQELWEGKYEKSQVTDEPITVDQSSEIVLKEIKQKMDKIKEEFKEQLKIKGLIDRIKHHLNGECPLIILRVDEMMDISIWEDIRYALSLLKCSADLLIVTTVKDNHLAKEYCYPPEEPIDYSLAGLYYDTVLNLTRQQKNEDNYNPQIFRDILEGCEPYEFCMKMFTHALYANPKRSNEELFKLHRNLQALPKSFNVIAKKMFMFSYNDLPKEYKSCLLYLAIFPMGHKIMRSTLIGRWVTEGLTLKEDWLSSVSHANRCFDALIYRCLVYPADIGATGKVQSCVVDKLVHGFITMIARKQHIVETRLSHQLARHFSIFNDLQLRNSDRIDKFFQRLSESSRVSLLKVLDLEGSRCIHGKIQRYLKDICTKMLLLKYLSLKGTDITQLPSEINNLHELEVLDIRQTKVPVNATANVLLLKLKRLLAGHIDLSPSNFEIVHSVQIPRRIDKMVNMEVLSNVKALNSADLKDIGKLWQLRKLGVVIDDKDSHLKHLLRAISDLHECLRSLSITLPIARHEGTPYNTELPANISSHLRYNPKRLESLTIRGITTKGHLLTLFTKDVNNKLVKVTLSSTLLNQDALNVLTSLPNLRCVKLQHIACPESILKFKKDEFKYLKYLLVEGSNLTNITFEDGATCELEKMVLSFTSIESISGADKLPRLEDLELKNNGCRRLLSSFGSAKRITKMTLCGTLLEQGDLHILAKKQNIRCLELLDKSFDASHNQIIFKKGEFAKLDLLIIDCSAITKIIFNSGSAPKLEKIVWSAFTSLSGIDKLPRLKELEFNGGHVPNEIKEAIGKHRNKPNLKHNEPITQDQAKGDEQEGDQAAMFSFFWKRQA